MAAPRQSDARALRHTLGVTLAMALLLPMWQFASAASVSEVKLKSAFLYNFTKFVEWPAERFVNASEPIVIGLMADEPMRAEIATIVANRLVNGRSLVIRPVVSVADMQASHILFVSSYEQARYTSMRNRALLSAVLMVGEGESCQLSGAGICFVQQGEKLRFEINIDIVEHSHLKIGAQLQKLAIAVNKGS
jgi:hypothetical protein